MRLISLNTNSINCIALLRVSINRFSRNLARRDRRQKRLTSIINFLGNLSRIFTSLPSSAVTQHRRSVQALLTFASTSAQARPPRAQL
jgi:hypothetical protein